ncbi:MAG TPA: hypothetical protein VIV06_11895 [Candidatus Limnocylindrales bacterium]
MTEQAPEVDPALYALQVRCGNGVSWLVEHDPSGRFHLWFTAGILPGQPMPAQPPEVQTEYRTYHRARQTWERLERELARMEGRRRAPLRTDLNWQGGQGRIRR